MNDCVFDDYWSSSSFCIQNLLVLVASVQPVCFIFLVISSKSLSRFKFFVSLLCIICQSFARISCGHASSSSEASRKSLISTSTLRSTSYRLFWASSRFRCIPSIKRLASPSSSQHQQFFFFAAAAACTLRSSSLIDPFLFFFHPRLQLLPL